MERIVNALEENPNRTLWKSGRIDYTIADAIVVTEKSMKPIKPEIINPCWRKLWPDVHDFTGLTMDPVEDIMKEVVGMTKRVAGDEFPDLGEI